MTHLPDFSSHGYQTTKQLPNHPEDSFNSYQAKRLKDNKCVVIKQARLTIA